MQVRSRFLTVRLTSLILLVFGLFPGLPGVAMAKDQTSVDQLQRSRAYMTLAEAAQYERKLGDEAVPTDQRKPAANLVPGASAAGASGEGSGLFNGIFGGTTSYDAQHFGSCHRQIGQAYCPDAAQSYVHVTWMKLHDTQDLNDPNRNVYYNVYNWNTTSWLLNIDPVHGGIALCAVGERAGYGHIELNSEGHAVVFHHSAVEGAPNYSQIAQYSVCGYGIFITDQMVNPPDEENIWPSGSNSVDPGDGKEYYHVVGWDSKTAIGDPAEEVYWRFDKNADTWAGPAIWDSTLTPSHIVLAFESRVVLGFVKPRDYGTSRSLYDNDLAYYECTDNGDAWLTTGFPTWAAGGGYNVTDYATSDMHRHYIETSGGFDSEGRLHLMFTNPGYDDAAGTISVGPTELLHWKETTPGGNSPAVPSPGADVGFNSANFHTVAQALWGTPGFGDGNEGSAGEWNRYICKISLAFGDGSTDCGGEPNLDYLYATYTQFGSRHEPDKADVSAAGMQNGNLWLSISNDKGGSWTPQRCITTIDGSIGGTPTRSPDCDPNAAPFDTCLSEHWSSSAPLVNDTLHVWYVGDLDAGSIPQGEGGWTMNDMMYLPIFGGTDGPLCPCECTAFCELDGTQDFTPVDVVYIVNYVYKNLDGRPVLPLCFSKNGDWNCNGEVNPVDVVYYVNFVYRSTGVGPCNPCIL